MRRRNAGVTAVSMPGGAGGSRRLRTSRDSQALVVVGLRADFYARSAAYSELLPYLQDHQVLVGPLDATGLRAAIEKPAARAGTCRRRWSSRSTAGRPRAALTSPPGRSIAQKPGETSAQRRAQISVTRKHHHLTAATRAGRLPLLAYALRQTWKNREGRRLTIAAYRATGGIDGAVAAPPKQFTKGSMLTAGLPPVGCCCAWSVLARVLPTLAGGSPSRR